MSDKNGWEPETEEVSAQPFFFLWRVPGQSKKEVKAMPPQAVAFAPPGTEEMTETAIGLGGAGITGIAEGVIIRMAPQLGALQPILTWGTLLGVPLVGAGGALFTRGMIGDLFKGVAAAGVGILGYSLPALVLPGVGKKPGGGQGQDLLGGGTGVKLLPQGAGAAQRAQAQVRSSVEF